jgi:hypothetical protein
MIKCIKEGNDMGKLWSLIIILLVCQCVSAMEQENNEPDKGLGETQGKEIPSLQSLALSQFLKTIKIDSPQFNALPFDLQELVMSNSGSLQEILKFAQENIQAITLKLFKFVPEKFVGALVDEKITIEEFDSIFQSMPIKLKRLLHLSFEHEVQTFIAQNPVKFFSFKPLGHFPHLPLEFTLGSHGLQPIVTKTAHSFRYYLVLYIGEKIQKFIVQDIQREKYLLGKTSSSFIFTTHYKIPLYGKFINILYSISIKLDKFAVEYDLPLREYVTHLMIILDAMKNAFLTSNIISPIYGFFDSYKYNPETKEYEQI